MPKVSRYDLKPLEVSAETIGERLARLRKTRGLTQQQLADKIGIGQTLITDYERSRIRLYDEMIIRFALALQVTTDEILGMKDSKHLEKQPSLRLMKRLIAIDELPEPKKKAILKTLDDLLKANS